VDWHIESRAREIVGTHVNCYHRHSQGTRGAGTLAALGGIRGPAKSIQSTGRRKQQRAMSTYARPKTVHNSNQGEPGQRRHMLASRKIIAGGEVGHQEMYNNLDMSKVIKGHRHHRQLNTLTFRIGEPPMKAYCPHASTSKADGWGYARKDEDAQDESRVVKKRRQRGHRINRCSSAETIPLQPLRGSRGRRESYAIMRWRTGVFWSCVTKKNCRRVGYHNAIKRWRR